MYCLPPTLPVVEPIIRPWIVQELDGRGRGVVSTELIPSGTVVLFESRPLVSVVHAERSHQACANCFGLRLAEVSTKFLPQPVVCSGCSQCVWCSEECRNQSTVLGTHPAQICFAYKRLAQLAASEAEEELDTELQSDARLLFFAYFFRRYRPEEFARWSLLCSVDTAPVVSPTNGSSASSAPVAIGTKHGTASTAEAEEEQRIELLHDTLVECLTFAARSIGAPETPTLPLVITECKTADPDPLPLPSPPSLALPSLAKQFTDLHISHPSDDLTQSLANDADLAVTRSLYLKTKCNGFALMAPNDKMGNRQTPRGYAIYPNAAMVNHSCMPNVARFDKIDARDVKYVKPGTTASVAPASTGSSSSSSSFNSSAPTSGSNNVATPTPSPIAMLSPADCNSSAAFTPLALELRTMCAIPPYTELTMSYVPLFWDREERQEQLRSEYGFKCRCDRCRLEKLQERAERAAGGGGEADHDHEHDHASEDGSNEEENEDEEDEEDDEGQEEALSDDDAIDIALATTAPLQLSRGELNVYCVKYICPSKICGGTMAPVRKDDGDAAATDAALSSPDSGQEAKPQGETMECNVCGKTRTDVQFHRQLAKEFGLRK